MELCLPNLCLINVVFLFPFLSLSYPYAPLKADLLIFALFCCIFFLSLRRYLSSLHRPLLSFLGHLSFLLLPLRFNQRRNPWNTLTSSAAARVPRGLFLVSGERATPR